MPRIRQYESQVSPSAAVPGRQATAADFGADMGGFGGALAKVGDYLGQREEREAEKLKRKQEQDAVFRVRKEMSEQRAQWAEYMVKAQEEAPPGAEGFSTRVMGEYRKSMGKMLEERADLPEAARRELELSQIEFGNHLMGQTLAFEAGSKAKKLRLDAEQFKSDATRLVFNDPSRFEYERDQFVKSVDGLGLKGDAASAVKVEALNEMAVAGVRGLVQRGQIRAAEKALKEGPLAEHINGSQAAALANAIDTERKRLETQHQLVVTQAKVALRSAQDRMAAGYELPADEQARLNALVKQAGDPQVSASFSLLRGLQQDQINWRKLTPQQLETEIRTNLEPAVREGGATAFEAERLDMARRLLGGMNQQVQTDPLGWASSQGIAKVQPINMDDPTSIRTRADLSRAVAGQYGNTAFFTPIELQQVKREWASKNPEDKLEFVNKLRDNAGPAAMLALRQLSEESTTDAYIGGLAVASPAHASVAANAWRGRMIIDQDKTRVPAAEQTNAAFRREIGDAGKYLPPETMAAVKATADALYIQGGGDPKFIGSDYAVAVRMALGGIQGNNDSGVAQINGTKVFLPPTVTRGDFTKFLDRATGDDWKQLSVTGNGPVYRNGKAADPADIADEGRFYMVGPNRYVIFMRSDNLPLLDPSGNYFTVELAPAKVKGR